MSSGLFFQLSIIFIYLVALVVIGLYFRKKGGESESNYYVAGQSVGPFVNGVAIFAATGSAASYMGFIGLGYKLGLTVSLIIIASAGAGYAIAQFGLAGPLQKAQKFTLSDFYGARYNKTTQIVGAIFTTVLLVIFMVPQLTGGAYVVNHLTGLPHVLSLIIISGVFVAYVTLGGMYAVTWTDFLQGSIMLICAFLILPITLLIKFGGFGAIFLAASKIDPNFAIANPAFTHVSAVGLFVATLLFMGASPHLVQRQLTARSPHAGRVSFIWALLFVGWIQFFAYTVIIPVGKATFPKLANPDYMILAVVSEYFPAIIAALILAGILAAIQSTTDALLMAVGSAVTNDIIKKFKPDMDSKAAVKMGRIVIISIGILVLLLALRPPGLIGVIAAMVLGGVASTFFFPLWLGIWWKRANSWGAIAGMIGGFVSFMIFNIRTFPMFAETLVGVSVSFVLVIVVSLLTQPPDEETLAFVKKIQD